MRHSWCPRSMTRRGFLAGMSAGALLLPGWSNPGFRDADRYPFEEISAERSGIRWRHTNGKSAEKYLPESTGAGCAFLDYDNDGWMDIYLVNSGPCDFWTPSKPLRNALYRNNRDGTFTDVTEKAGVPGNAFGMGVAVGDYDRDGLPDLYVTQYPHSILYHNNGDGTFHDVSKDSGISAHLGKAWGAVATDINNDGLMDLWVADDTVANFLFVNRGKGKFDEIATIAGVAYSADGKARSGMGVDSADFDQDGWMDLFVINLDRELFFIYKNNHDETFDDVALPTGIGKATKFMSGWGLKFVDYDNDGNLDLFLANGNPDDLISSLHGEVTYEEPLMLFHNTGKSFQNVSVQSGPIFSKPLAARGLAIGDFDNDGG